MVSDDTDGGSDNVPPLIEENSPALSQFIENMGLQYEEYGVPKIGGKILGLLLVAPRPVSSEEMAATLQVSRSSISSNLRTLTVTGLIEKVSLPGERVDFYNVAPEAWEKSLELCFGSLYDLRASAQESMDELSENHPGHQRLRSMIAWVDLVNGAYVKILQELQSQREVSA
ncbi:MAG: helix-turn-helix domain-containing protein [Anaerolineaceae bacterium]|jgi:DNA-binding transcriptional regulator GbsR (MarR family)